MLLNQVEMLILDEFRKGRDTRIYGSEISKRYGLNQKTVSNTFNRLEKEGILKFKREGNNKYYFLNKLEGSIKEVIEIVEIKKKIEFKKNNPWLNGLISELEKRAKGVLGVFGSYAKGTNRDKSDLDVFVIGKMGDIKGLGDAYNIEINVVEVSKVKFNRSHPFVRDIIEYHIILNGVEDFVRLVW